MTCYGAHCTHNPPSFFATSTDPLWDEGEPVDTTDYR